MEEPIDLRTRWSLAYTWGYKDSFENYFFINYGFNVQPIL